MINFTIPKHNDNLEFTGERFVPGRVGEVEFEHIHRYLFASRYVENKDVLDIASGEGFGSYILSQAAKSVQGVDISSEAVDNANKLYQASNLSYQIGSCQKIPFPDNSFDIVVSFETLEHIYEQEEFLAEVKRVLRPSGKFIISTPDTIVYSNGEPTTNHYHVKELTTQEFTNLLSNYFKHQHLFGQKCLIGSTIIKSEFATNTKNEFFVVNEQAEYTAKDTLSNVPFLIIIASDQNFEDTHLYNSFFEADFPLNVVEKMEHNIKILEGEVQGLNTAINGYKEWVAKSDKLNLDLNNYVNELEARLESNAPCKLMKFYLKLTKLLGINK